MLIVVISLVISLALLLKRPRSFLMPSNIVIIYVSLMQLYALLAPGIFPYGVSFPGTAIKNLTVSDSSYAMLGYMSVIICFSAYLAKINIAINNKKFNASLLLNKSIMTMNKKLIQAIGLALLVWLLLHYICIDYHSYFGTHYNGALKDLNFIGADDTVSRILHLLSPLVGLVALGAVFISIKKKLILSSIILFIVFLYCFLMEFAENSRMIAIYAMIASGLVFLMFRSLALSGSLAFFSLLLLAKANAGRRIIMGLGATPEIIDMVISDGGYDFLATTFGSLLMGGILFVHAAEINPDYTEIYKILSLSPLPSFIDGFQNVRSSNEVRLNVFVPLSAISEIFHFGIVYMLVYLFGLSYLYRLSNIAVSSGSALGIATGYPVFGFITAITFQYSVRTSWRFVLLSIIFLSILNYARSRRVKLSM